MVAIMWHRRDLRIRDNCALVKATAHDIVIPVFVVDPFFFRDERETCNDRIHFMVECLKDLDEQYKKIGSQLIILYGDTLSELQKIQQEYDATVYYNFDTNMPFGFKRDKVAQKLPKFIGCTNDGIIRKPYNRNDWAKHVQSYMAEKTYSAPKALTLHDMQSSYSLDALRSEFPKHKKDVLLGGRTQAIKRLKIFYSTINQYPKSISKPLAAENYCSRLSAYLSFGCLSIREVFQAVHKGDPRHFYCTRLFWNQHFTQKLQDFPELPFKTANPYFRKYQDILYAYDEQKVRAWKEGKTGYPLIDASMRCLVQTGWLNFRMRAMVASFFVYILRQPWKIGADFMHYHLIDADTAINYAQWQMQAGLAGTHPHRIYNPTKQIIDNDPNGAFVRKYVKELEKAPMEFLTKDPCQSSLLFQYISPIVNYEKKAKEIRVLLKEISNKSQ